MKTFTLVGLVLFFGACVHYSPRPLHPDAAAAILESRSLRDPALKTFMEKRLHHDIAVWPPKSWTLDLLTLAAFYYHPDLAVASAQWQVAKASIDSAKERPNPTLALSPEFNSTPSGLSPWILGASFDLPLEIAHKRKHRIAEATAHTESARLAIAETAWQIRARVRDALHTITEMASTEALLDDERDREQKNFTILKERFSQQLVSPSNLNAAELQIAALDTERSELKKRKTEARSALSAAIGIPLAALDHVPLSDSDFNSVPQLPPQELRRKALTNRPDILKSLSEYAAAEANLALEVAKQYPNIHLGPGYTFDQGDNKWALGISLELPVVNQNRGAIKEALARRAQKEAEFVATQTKVMAEIEAAEGHTHASLATLEAVKRTLALEEAKTKPFASFTQGDLGRVNALVTSRNLYTAHRAVIAAHADVQTALGALEDALAYPLFPTLFSPTRIEEGLRRQGVITP